MARCPSFLLALVLLGLQLGAAVQAFVAVRTTVPTSPSVASARRVCGGARGPGCVVMAAADGDEGAKKKRGWPVGRALRTFLQFNGPRLFPRRRRSKEEDAGAAVAPSMGQGTPLAHGVVLVTGGTGGLGKRVVTLLHRKGLRVRALARNRQKALAMLSKGQEPEKGSGLEIVQADVADAKQLTAAIMDGVVAVVACTAAIVQPKAGDTEDRARYYQGGCDHVLMCCLSSIFIFVWVVETPTKPGLTIESHNTHTHIP